MPPLRRAGVPRGTVIRRLAHEPLGWRQAAILNLMREIQRRTGVAVLLITHNPAVARYFSHRTAVVYLGRIVENGDESLYREPRHPYTRALLHASPSLAVARPQRVRLSGTCRTRTTAARLPLPHPLPHRPTHAPGTHRCAPTGSRRSRTRPAAGSPVTSRWPERSRRPGLAIAGRN